MSTKIVPVRAALSETRDLMPLGLGHLGQQRPHFHVGVNSCKTMVGLVGADGLCSYTAIGETVNRASRLEGQAKVNQVVNRSRDLDRPLPEGMKAEPLIGVQVKGKEAPIEAYVVIELPPDWSELYERS